MKILICCEFFHPSIGGVQEVVKQIANRFADQGHTITIVTTFLPQRVSDKYRKIRIKSFGISGNLVNGFLGDIEAYRHYMTASNYDLLFIYAAQQWTFDALIGFIEKIKAKKVLVPCGFSGLYSPIYKNYFYALPKTLKQFDALIFHSKNYRDYEFAKNNGLNNLFFVPNGASEFEFEKVLRGFKNLYNISFSSFFETIYLNF